MAEPTYDEVLKVSLNSKRLLYRQVISSFMIKFLCNVEVNLIISYLKGFSSRFLFSITDFGRIDFDLNID